MSKKFWNTIRWMPPFSFYSIVINFFRKIRTKRAVSMFSLMKIVFFQYFSAAWIWLVENFVLWWHYFSEEDFHHNLHWQWCFVGWCFTDCLIIRKPSNVKMQTRLFLLDILSFWYTDHYMWSVILSIETFRVGVWALLPIFFSSFRSTLISIHVTNFL